MIRAGFPLCRENVVYLYMQLVWGAVKANTGNSIVLCMAHMSGALLLGPLTLRHSREDHISMCGCIVVHWSSISNLRLFADFLFFGTRGLIPSLINMFSYYIVQGYGKGIYLIKIMCKIKCPKLQTCMIRWFTAFWHTGLSAGQLSLVRVNEPADD